jgi:hypothetical protein
MMLDNGADIRESIRIALRVHETEQIKKRSGVGSVINSIVSHLEEKRKVQDV